MRAVFDTNVLVSHLLIADSVSRQAVGTAISNAEIVTSEATLNELADVLGRGKLDRYVSLADRQEFIRRFMQIATKVSVITEINDCQDPADNHFLALALDAEAKFIVTGDKALLRLGPWRDIRILTPGAFVTTVLEQ